MEDMLAFEYDDEFKVWARHYFDSIGPSARTACTAPAKHHRGAQPLASASLRRLVRACAQLMADTDGDGTIDKKELSVALSATMVERVHGTEVNVPTENVYKLKLLLNQHGVRLDGGAGAIFERLDWVGSWPLPPAARSSRVNWAALARRTTTRRSTSTS